MPKQNGAYTKIIKILIQFFRNFVKVNPLNKIKYAPVRHVYWNRAPLVEEKE